MTPRWRGAMSGAVMMAGGLSYSATAMAGGYVISALGYPSLFVAGLIETAAGGLSSGLISECHAGRWGEWLFPLTTADARATSIGGFRS